MTIIIIINVIIIILSLLLSSIYKYTYFYYHFIVIIIIITNIIFLLLLLSLLLFFITIIYILKAKIGRPLVMNSRTPGSCWVLLLHWVAPLLFDKWPERFYLFWLVHFKSIFWKCHHWQTSAVTLLAPFILLEVCNLATLCSQIGAAIYCQTTASLQSVASEYGGT